eukprot:m.114118 g.114118  ORF g.114118 m.114118 type:complete len:60 (-) comp13040_c0_seq2:45-224(-)
MFALLRFDGAARSMGLPSFRSVDQFLAQLISVQAQPKVVHESQPLSTKGYDVLVDAGPG